MKRYSFLVFDFSVGKVKGDRDYKEYFYEGDVRCRSASVPPSHRFPLEGNPDVQTWRPHLGCTTVGHLSG